MNSCKDCIVDMICTKECPNFEIDLDRLKTDEVIYLKRCMNNHKVGKTYKLSNYVKVDVKEFVVVWRNNKNGNTHRDNDKPAIIKNSGDRFWFKEGICHRDNDKPAIIWHDGFKRFYKRGIRYEAMQ